MFSFLLTLSLIQGKLSGILQFSWISVLLWLMNSKHTQLKFPLQVLSLMQLGREFKQIRAVATFVPNKGNGVLGLNGLPVLLHLEVRYNPTTLGTKHFSAPVQTRTRLCPSGNCQGGSTTESRPCVLYDPQPTQPQWGAWWSWSACRSGSSAKSFSFCLFFGQSLISAFIKLQCQLRWWYNDEKPCLQ